MILCIYGHTYKYETEKICSLFFPAEKIVVFSDEKPDDFSDSKIVRTRITEGEKEVIFYSDAVIDGKSASASYEYKKDCLDSDSHRERILAKVLSQVLRDLTGINPPWGILTGIRPAKLMRNYIGSSGEESAVRIFREFFEVSEEKTALALNVAKYENICVGMTGEKSFSLYVSIPFCPSRCSYCSFVSHSVDKAQQLIPDYVEKLCEEIRYTGKIASENGLVPETLYVGGGTPTSFSADKLRKITDALCDAFDISSVREFTVEAGRPDTIDEEKLTVLRDAGVTRISINPQTFSDSVLRAVGRRHSAEDTVEKYKLARKLGFDNINMDLIAGLPTDTVAGFAESVDKAISLAPENITVHTLALKRSSSIVTENEKDTVNNDTARMLSYASARLYENGYKPYYMYRQSKTVGNLENVGWCKEGRPCLYNIYMMEEIHTVLATGAGAVTKLVKYGEDSLKRVYNFKYPYEYISDFDIMLERKNEITKFYSGDNS